MGVCYALIVEEIQTFLPFVNTDNMFVWVGVTVVIAQALDNAVFQPIVLGSAVNLHPLVVIIGVMGGSTMFGIPGMLLAIPFIVVVKVIVNTTFKEMKAYRIT